MSGPALHSISLPGVMLERGFWLYVWRIRAEGETMLYVGRTGDESSPHASAPYDCFGQHLGRNRMQNALRRNLETRGITLAQVDHYDFLFYGPVHSEAADMAAHIPLRDAVAATEKKLADQSNRCRIYRPEPRELPPTDRPRAVGSSAGGICWHIPETAQLLAAEFRLPAGPAAR